MTISERAQGGQCPTCGAKAKAKVRSIDQHRRYFGLIRAAFHHWPETSERQFANEEELRAYVQIKAGYREVGAQIPLSGLNKDRALMLVEAAIRGSGSYAIPIFYKDSIVVFKPKSVSFEKMSHQEFCGLNESVATVIEQEIGISADELLRQTEAAA
jgi:hypothetical protein